MSARTITGIIGLAAMALAGSAFFVLHSRDYRSSRAMASVPRAKSDVVARGYSRPAEISRPSPPPVRDPASGDHGKTAAVAEPEATARAGEQLEFAADVSKLSNVATLRLNVLDHRDFFGKPAWHLQAFAHTENPLRMVFELDDQFDSYCDAGTFSSLQYEMHLNERGEKIDSVQRMVTNGRDATSANVTATRVLPGTRDPLGLMQYLRNVDWSRSQEVRSPVYDGHKLYDVRASLAGTAEKISVPAGNFSASKLDIHVFDNGAEMKDAQFALYLANTAARTPLLLEAVLPFATARVELVKAK